MSQLLHIDSSPRGADSASLAIAKAFLDDYRERQPEVKVDAVNLFDAQLPEFGTVAAAAKIATFSGQEHTPEQAAAWEQARTVFDQLEAADELVFNVPMWNAGVPYVLKQWIDIVTQPGWAFGFDPEAGYSGLLPGKKALVVYSAGVYQPGRPLSFGADFASTFFNDWLRFVGIEEVTEVRHDAGALQADPTAHLEESTAKAREIAQTF